MNVYLLGFKGLILSFTLFFFSNFDCSHIVMLSVIVFTGDWPSITPAASSQISFIIVFLGESFSSFSFK